MKFLPFLLLLILPAMAQAQSLRMRTNAPVEEAKAVSPWEGNLRYGISSDYADDRTPRGYMNSLTGSVTYNATENWHVGVEAGARAEVVGGQVDKDSEQSATETLNTSISAEVGYDGKIGRTTVYSLFAHGEPLMDEASRLEGYKSITGAGAALKLSFFSQIYSLTNMVDLSQLANEYRDNLAGEPNPDIFVTYKLGNSVRLSETWRASYTFGLKATKYTDGFWGYSYNNSFAVSKAFGNLAVAFAYENGGFTDNGDVNLWYIDDYRRIAHFMVSYKF